MWQLGKPEQEPGIGEAGIMETLPDVYPSDNGNGKRPARLNAIKSAVHQRLLERLDMAQLEGLQDSLVAEEIRGALLHLFEEVGEPLSPEEKQAMTQDLEFEVLGLGPLEPLLKDPSISDILVNRFDQVYIERYGKLEKTDIRFWDNKHLLRIINKIVSNVGRRIDESSLLVDARLPDGSRVNAVIPPLTLDGPSLSIRRFAVHRPTLEDLIAKGSLTPEIGEVLKAIAVAKLNIIVSGGTGSGKTTMLNVLSSFIPADERIITIEDSAELQLQQEHVVRMETRTPNLEGKGAITQRDLVRNSLRMRPDRIIVGEVRGAEVIDMFQAMNTGHEGSMTTIHANTARDALVRLETMIQLSGVKIEEKAMRQMISSSVDIIIQLARLNDGSRRMISLSEITGVESGIISMQDIFVFKRQGMDDNHKVVGRFAATGVRPRFADRCKVFGVPLPEDIFNPPTEHY